MVSDAEKAAENERFKVFAAERSQNDATVSNETIRATGQYAILINGGAATAILAYLSKDNISPQLLRHVSLCLAGYGLGVVFAACMLFSSKRSLDGYQRFWREIAFPSTSIEGIDASGALTGGKCWLRLSDLSFFLTIACFFLASFYAAVSIASAPPVNPSPPLCNLYSLTKGQQVIRQSVRDTAGNLPALPGIFLDGRAPVVFNASDGECELGMMRWGIPEP